MFHFRKKVRVSKIVVHENFTSNLNDIALLKLGIIKIALSNIILTTKHQRRVWIFQASALSVSHTTTKANMPRRGMFMVRSVL